MSYTTPYTWPAGGTYVVTAAKLNEQLRDNMDYVYTNLGYDAGYLVASGTLAGTTSYTFSSIPATYRHLRVRGYGIYSALGDFSLVMRYNSDSGNNYCYGLWGVIVNTSAANLAAADSASYIMMANAGKATSLLAVEGNIYNYSGTSGVRAVNGAYTGRYYTGGFGGHWLSVGTAINAITFQSSAGTHSLTGVISIYGYNQ